ncbi:MAG: type II secretion system minor pseudopilin GspK [Steroidobacteraceae bacterium]|jgi:general secretion pathway protein K
MSPLARRGSQRGIALITAIVLVAVAAVVATAIGFSSAMSARRASTVFGADQSLLAAEGAEAMAAYVLKQSGSTSPTGSTGTTSTTGTGATTATHGASSQSTSGTASSGGGASSPQDSLDQPWAQSYGPFELLPGVLLEFAQLEDQQGKFNLNNLADGGATDPTSVTQFQQLLSLLGIEPRWAGLIADWIDSDDQPNFPDGAEDSVYLAQSPQYRTANLPITSISELLALPGFGRDRYNRLAPYVSALPSGTTINVCTASGVLLDAISGKTEYSTDPQQLLSRRQSDGCFPTLQVYLASLNAQQQALATGRLGQTTSYFRLRSFITIGTARFSLYSLLQRDGATQIHVILRTFGTE